jgi:hypothetical protein
MLVCKLMLIYEDIYLFGRNGDTYNLKQCKAFFMDEHGWKWDLQSIGW